MNEYYELIEKILTHFTSSKFTDELILAKKEFFDNFEKLEEQSEMFEARMNQFYDWYFFTRPLSQYRQTPVEVCHLERELRFTDEEKSTIEILKLNRHSLFQFIKIKENDIHLKDLISDKKIIVKSSPWVYGFDEDEIFDARLIPMGKDFIFARGFCFHPEEAKKFIFAEVKKIRKDPDLNPEDLILRLVRMKFKFERYKFVNPELIYSNENRVGV